MPLDVLDRDDLREDQHFLIDEIVRSHGRKPGVWAIVDMSLGKTVSSLTAIFSLLNQGRIRKVLVVAPKRVATDTWPTEMAKWRHLRGLTFSVLCGSAAQRVAALEEDTEVHIINRENVVWLYEMWEERGGWPYDAMIYDESSRLKEGRKRTGLRRVSEFGALAKVRSLMDIVVELTGTPFPGGIEDAWGQGYIMDLGYRLGSTKRAFYDRWFTKDYNGFTYTPRPGAEEEIRDRLKDITVRIKASDVMKVPKVKPHVEPVRLPKKIMKKYRRFEKELALAEFDVEAVNRGVLVNKLVQFANGNLYRIDEDDSDAVREVIPIHNRKIKAMKRLVKRYPDENLLVAYGFRFDLERLRKAFPYAVVADEDPEAIAKWNRGEIKMLLAHPASIGHGLNLQFGGHRAIWYGLTASLELYEQFNMRLPRPGQRAKKVHIHHLVAEGTFDERLIYLLRKKGGTQDRLVSAFKRYLREAA